MTAIAFFCALIAAPTLEISIAPDQPVPYVYTDDPVILQFKSSEDGKATGQVSITGDDGKTGDRAPNDPLRAVAPLAASALPRRTVSSTCARRRRCEVEYHLVYCRIDRLTTRCARRSVRVGALEPTVSTYRIPPRLRFHRNSGARSSRPRPDRAPRRHRARFRRRRRLPSLDEAATTLGDNVSAWRPPSD